MQPEFANKSILLNTSSLNYKPGQALALVDGQDGVQENIVPRIQNPDTLCRGVRLSLDRQPGIPELTRAVAAGRRTGL